MLARCPAGSRETGGGTGTDFSDHTRVPVSKFKHRNVIAEMHKTPITLSLRSNCHFSGFVISRFTGAIRKMCKDI